MKAEKAKSILAEMLASAVDFDRRGDIVLRNQTVCSILDLPLPLKYLRAALADKGLPTK